MKKTLLQTLFLSILIIVFLISCSSKNYQAKVSLDDVPLGTSKTIQLENQELIITNSESGINVFKTSCPVHPDISIWKNNDEGYSCPHGSFHDDGSPESGLPLRTDDHLHEIEFEVKNDVILIK